MTRVAVYAEVDMNLIDGSSIWLQSVGLMLGALDTLEVTVLLRTPSRRALLTAPLLAHPRVTVIDPAERGFSGPRLAPVDAVQMLAELDAERSFDIVLLRGASVVDTAISEGRFEGRLWYYYVPPHGSAADSDATELIRRAGWSGRVLCQTEAIAERVASVVRGIESRLTLLPPMVPDGNGARPRAAGPVRSLLYAGKFSPEYFFLEMVDLFTRLQPELAQATWHVAGDKIHNPPTDPAFRAAAERALRETTGLVWHGAVTREGVRRLAETTDVALSLRHPSMDSSTELSTKILEYGAAGCAVVLNRNPLHRRLLGDDYPLLAGGVDEARAAIARVSADPDLRAAAAEACHALSQRHTFSRVAAGLAGPLGVAPASVVSNGAAAGTAAAGTAAAGAVRNPAGSPRLLLAGHEFHFFTELADHAVDRGVALREDKWAKHVVHDEAASLDALAWSEAIHCEWCLGAAGFYSRRRSDSQRLTVRFHRMEIETPYPGDVDLDRVDVMVFVAEHVLEAACQKYGWPRDHPAFRIIPNMIDAEALALPKLPGAEFTLGFIGWVPMIKRFDRALSVLERLRAHDDRFRLLVKGKGPWDYYWMESRPAERRFYETALARIERSPLLRGAVIFEPYGPLPAYLQKVGWILSVSDIEGHGVAPAEGMASGAIPIVVERPGARQQYAENWVHRDPNAAAAAILEVVSRGEIAHEAERAHAWAQAWSRASLLPQWDEVLALGAG